MIATLASMPDTDRILGERFHAIVRASAPILVTKTLVRDACLCQGGQGRLLLPERAEVQDEVLDNRFHARGKSR